MTKGKGFMHIRRILAAVDGSPHSIKAVKLASQIAKGLGAELTLIHVAEVYEIPTLITEAENGYSEKKGQLVLGESAKIAKHEGVEAKVVMRKGHIVDQILRFISSYKPDIVVMGGRGLSRVKGIFMGSVSQGVSQNAKCTVLIAR